MSPPLGRGASSSGHRSGERPALRPERRRLAHLRVPARLRESTHDSLAAPPVTVRAAHGRCAGHSPLPSRDRGPSGGDGRRIRGAVVVSGWLVRGDSWVESPPRAGYPLDDVLAPPAPESPRLSTMTGCGAGIRRCLVAACKPGSRKSAKNLSGSRTAPAAAC